MVYLWAFRSRCTFSSHLGTVLLCEGGAGAIFLAPNHSVPSAGWSFLINHMFHNLGILAIVSHTHTHTPMHLRSHRAARLYGSETENCLKLICILCSKPGTTCITARVQFNLFFHLLRQVKLRSGLSGFHQIRDHEDQNICSCGGGRKQVCVCLRVIG